MNTLRLYYLLSFVIMCASLKAELSDTIISVSVLDQMPTPTIPAQDEERPEEIAGSVTESTAKEQIPFSVDHILEYYHQNTMELATVGSQDTPVMIDVNNQIVPATRKTAKLDAVYIQNSLTQINQNTSSLAGALNSSAQNIINAVQGLNLESACTKIITNADINPNGYMITAPGVYCINEDLFFNPAVSGLSAIVINASAVNIQMNHHSIFKVGAATDTTGILINGTNGAAIQDGNLIGFDLYGIRANSGSVNMEFQGMFITGCGRPTNSGGGISANLSTNVKVIDCDMANNFFSGMQLFGVNRCLINNSSFTGTQQGILGAQTEAIGLFISISLPASGASTPCENITVLNSNATGNMSSSGNAFGFFASGLFTPLVPNISLTFENCVANDNVAGGVAGEGFEFFVSEDIVLKNCNAQHNQCATFGAAFGITASINGVLEDCIAQNQTSTAMNGIASGFSFLASNQMLVKNCSASASTALTGTAIGFATQPVGFPTLPSVTNIIFEECTAQNTAGTLNVGFNFSSAINSVLRLCTSFNNGIGFNVVDPAAPQVALNNVIKDCAAYGNIAIGFVDSTPLARNAYIANRARANGINYAIPVGNPIRTWPLPASPSPVDNNMITPIADPMDNIDITP